MQGMDHSKMGGMAIGDTGMMNRAAIIPELADNPAPDDADVNFAKGMSPHLTPDAARSHFNETFNSRRKTCPILHRCNVRLAGASFFVSAT